MRIGIVGLGLIGGSLAIDLRARGHQVAGVSRNPGTCARAVERGIADAADVEPGILANCDVVFLCPPLGAIVDTARQVVPHLRADAVLTDVGSVKGPLVEQLHPLWPRFVGGHPMAGTAESGLDAAIPDLFVGRPWVVTPTAGTDEAAVTLLEGLVRSLAADVVRCAPEQHDRAAAWISHLPVMVSASLISACLTEGDPNVAALSRALASSGFHDTSRVGGGNPELGRMMAELNTGPLLATIARFRDELDALRQAIEAGDWDGVEARLQRAQQARPEFVDKPAAGERGTR